MTTQPFFKTWDETHSALWGHQPIRLSHELHKRPLFSMDTLAALIERYPREHYSLIQTGGRRSKRLWREGEIGNLRGHQVIEAISRGELWLNLRNVGLVDRRYHEVIGEMFAEVAERVPGFDIRDHQEGILLSSPETQVYYHSDMPGQGLIQIAGRKRVYVYPNTAPFVRPQHIEDIALYDVEVDMPYESWYDAHAKVFDIGPGDMLSWELNAPHRVENLNTFNISMTVSFTNQEIRRSEVVSIANGLLRRRFGYEPKTRNLSGPTYFAKAMLEKALRNSRWIKRERKARRSIDFTLDAADPGKVVELPKAA